MSEEHLVREASCSLTPVQAHRYRDRAFNLCDMFIAVVTMADIRLFIASYANTCRYTSYDLSIYLNLVVVAPSLFSDCGESGKLLERRMWLGWSYRLLHNLYLMMLLLV